MTDYTDLRYKKRGRCIGMFYLFACMVAAVGEPLLLQQFDQVLTDVVPEIHPFEVDAFDCFV